MKKPRITHPHEHMLVCAYENLRRAYDLLNTDYYKNFNEDGPFKPELGLVDVAVMLSHVSDVIYDKFDGENGEPPRNR